MKLIAALFLVAASVSTAAAGPSTSSDAASMAQSDCARAHKLGKTCVLSFEGDNLNGKVVSPDGTDIAGKTNVQFTSLIRLRYDFRAEIIQAAEDL